MATSRRNERICIIAGIVALLAIICIFVFSGGTPKAEKLTLDKSSVSFSSGQTERLNVSIEPKEATPELIWQSSNESVVKVLDGVITAKNVGKATIKVFVKDREDLNAVCECSVIVEDVDMETMDILEEPIFLRPGGHQQLTIKVTPENQNETISWTSSDETIAKVSHKGKVEAIKIGEALIIAKSDRTGVADTAAVTIEGSAGKQEEKAEETKPTTTRAKTEPAVTKPVTTRAKTEPVVTKPATTPARTKPAVTKSATSQSSNPVPSSKSKDFGYATFKGSWPNDVNGRMVFKTSHVIDSRDPKGRVAEAGDYVIGEWSEGHLVQGIWYGADNTVKGSIIIGI